MSAGFSRFTRIMSCFVEHKHKSVHIGDVVSENMIHLLPFREEIIYHLITCNNKINNTLSLHFTPSGRQG